MADHGLSVQRMRANWPPLVIRNWRWPGLIAAAVLVLGIGLSVASSQWVRLELRRDAQLRVDALAANAAVQVERRFAAYAEVLQGLRALFHSGEVSRETFRRFTAALDLKGRLPGFQVLNYAPFVPAASRDHVEKAVPADPSWPAHLRFSISPAGTRESYHPFTLMEPLAGNEHLLGRDIAAPAHVRATLEVARDTGTLTTSGRLIQVQGVQRRFGLALRLPVYRAGLPAGTLTERRTAYIGSVGAGFLVAEMLANLAGVPATVRVRLFEGGPEPIVEQASAGPSTEADKLVFDSADPGAGGAPGAASTRAAPVPGDHLRSLRSFRLGDRVWQVEISAPAAAVARPLDQWLPLALLAAGIAVAACLSGLLLALMVFMRKAAGPPD